MNTPLFRGKRKKTGEWITSHTHVHTSESDVYLAAHKPMVLQRNADGDVRVAKSVNDGECLFYDIDTNTLGLCTWKNGKDGKQIFEGDIFRYANGLVYKVVWDNIMCGFYAESTSGKNEDYDYLGNFLESYIEIIGNVHDNPELLKGE